MTPISSLFHKQIVAYTTVPILAHLHGGVEVLDDEVARDTAEPLYCRRPDDAGAVEGLEGVRDLGTVGHLSPSRLAAVNGDDMHEG